MESDWYKDAITDSVELPVDWVTLCTRKSEGLGASGNHTDIMVSS